MIVSKNIRERCFTTGTRKNKWRLHRAFTACTLVTRFFAVMITTVKNSDNEKKMFLCTRKLDKLSIGYFVSLKFSWFYFVFKDNFPNTSPWGAYIWRGDLMEGFLRYRFWGLIFGGAYFRNFKVFMFKNPNRLVANQLSFHDHDWRKELGTTENKSSWQTGQDF